MKPRPPTRARPGHSRPKPIPCVIRTDAWPPCRLGLELGDLVLEQSGRDRCLPRLTLHEGLGELLRLLVLHFPWHRRLVRVDIHVYKSQSASRSMIASDAIRAKAGLP